MARTSIKNSKWAITGVAPGASTGFIVAWHDDDELGAHRDARDLRKQGYTEVNVISTTLDGELEELDEQDDPDYE